MNRRGFLQACLAASTAPYVLTTAGVLMPSTKVITLTDDALREAIQQIYRWVEDRSVVLYKEAGWNIVLPSEFRCSVISYHFQDRSLMKIQLEQGNPYES